MGWRPYVAAVNYVVKHNLDYGYFSVFRNSQTSYLNSAAGYLKELS